MKVDNNLNWKIHILDLISKLNRAKQYYLILHFTNFETLRFVYFAAFQIQVNYLCIA